MTVNNLSTPPSPSYPIIKTEEGLQQQQQNIDYLMYSQPFDLPTPQQQQPPQHVLPSQRSPQQQPQQRMIPYNDVSLMHQRQHHHQQQHQMRLQQQQFQQYHSQQQQQQQQQLMYETTPTTPDGRTSISSAMSMSLPLSVSIPVTSGSSALMIQTPTSANSGNSSSSLFTPTTVSTSIPFFHGSPSTPPVSHHRQQQSSHHGHHPYAAISSPGGVIHPASPKRQRQNSMRNQQQHLGLAQLSPSSIESNSAIGTFSDFSGALASPPMSAISHNTIAAAAAIASATMTPVMSSSSTTAAMTPKSSRRSSTASSSRSLMNTPRFDKVKDSRTTRVTKNTSSTSSSSSSSAPSSILAATGIPNAVISTASAIMTNKSMTTRTSTRRTNTDAAAAAAGVTLAASPNFPQLYQLSPQQHQQQPHPHPHHHPHPHTMHSQQQHPTPIYTHLPTGTGNVTHPRRAAQNRAAQRTFRNRRKAYIKDMESRVQELDSTRARMESVQQENKEVWRRYKVLESLILQNHLTMPSFPELTPFFETEAGAASLAVKSSGAGADHGSTDAANVNTEGGDEGEGGGGGSGSGGVVGHQSPDIFGDGEVSQQQYQHNQ
ncbi:hypothetical protein BGZ72_003616, partial [Mortierella alpina]